jgi:SWI/SNF-related matrix-associated actin-dependent regulator of chromatin subfamily D
VPQWELKIEGRILDSDPSKTDGAPSVPSTQIKTKPKKFSSFFKSLVIELDKDLYGPDNHLVEWHRTAQTAETDGFQVKRHGDQTLKCTILMLLDYQPPQFKLDSRLAKLLSIHTATRPVIIQSLWQYIKVHKLQDNQEKEFINLDKYLQQIFECDRIRFSDIPNKLNMHCMPPDPIVINHMIK